MNRRVAVFALVLAACAAPKAEPGPDAVEAPDPTVGPVVSLRPRANGGEVDVDVVARHAGAVGGAALRLTWDPAALDFVRAEKGRAWSSGAVSLAKEGTPGQLAVAWSEKGAARIAADAETVLGTLVFRAKAKVPVTLAFRAERSSLVDGDGRDLGARWRGASVPLN